MVPVYVRQPVSDVVAPSRRLVGFVRVELAAGASTPEHVSFPVSELAVTTGDIDASGRRAVEPRDQLRGRDSLPPPGPGRVRP
jgi:beta-glucosidase